MVVLPSFSSADNFYSLSDFWSTIVDTNNTVYSVVWDSNSISCIYWVSATFCNNLRFKFLNEDDWYFLADSSLWSCTTYKPVCFSWSNTFQFKRYNSSNNITVRYFKLPLNTCPSCPSCPTCEEQYTSLQCQTEYNLIPISSVDSEYCENNNLCSSSDCPIYTWDLTPWVSNVYINDVFHPWAFNVIINIPEEIDRDYAYTNSWSNFNLDVVWYNQDTEYINWLIDINNYKPTSDDFSKVFWLFSNYWWLLVACLFVILVFYFVKKLF